MNGDGFGMGCGLMPATANRRTEASARLQKPAKLVSRPPQDISSALPARHSGMAASATTTAREVGTVIGVAALGVLAVIGMWKLSLLFIRMVAAYVRFNARLVARRR